jgi:predicted nucleotidyltransferase
MERGLITRQFDRTKVLEEIREMARIITERFHPHKIILFGSFARDTAGPDSDADLLVVMPFSGRRREIETEIDLALADRRIPLDVIVVTPDEVERERDLVGTIIRPALREGMALHEQGG